MSGKIGYDGAGDTTITLMGAMYFDGKFTASSSFTATHIKVYIGDTNNHYLSCAIYDVGSPQKLIQSSNFITPVANSWNIVDLAGASIVNGTEYWLCFTGTGGFDALSMKVKYLAGAGAGDGDDFLWPLGWVDHYINNPNTHEYCIMAYGDGLNPAANFTGTPVTFTYPAKVAFTDTSTNSPTSWDWDFGDGSFHSTDQNPTHIYLHTGSFAVVLIATNSYGPGTKTALAFITSSASLILGNNY